MVELLNTIARLWWEWTVSMFWQVGLLILLIGCLDLLIRRWAWPQLRYALWSLILVKLLLPPTLSLPSGLVPEVRPRVAQALHRLNSEKPVASEGTSLILNLESQISDFNLEADPQFGSFATWTDGIEGPVARASVGASSEAPSSKWEVASGPSALQTSHFTLQTSEDLFIWQFYAMLLWLSGTLILGLWLFLRLHSVAGRHAYRAAAASLPQSFYNHLAGCAERLGLRRIPRVAVTHRLTNPAVFGVLSPVLLMPKGYLSKLSRRDTEHMLLHELAHIKRGDLVMHGLYLLLQIVYWYNPLLWLVRQQVHHLRELSCDGTVAELLRERTGAYRQTLLETARRLLATSAEPGLGLLGLFEDSNRLLVRLHWLTKPTWRYKTMKRMIVATIAVLMFACVLPMAQARESAARERRPSVVREEDQALQDDLSQDIAALETRLEELRNQQRQLQEELRALSAKREQVRPSRQAPRPSRERTAVQPRAERAPEHVPAAPPEHRSAGGYGRSTGDAVPHTPHVAPPMPPAPPHVPESAPPEVREQVRRAQEQMQRAQEQAQQAMQEAARAQREALRSRAETGRARSQEQQQALRHMQALGEQLDQWERSDEVQKWQRDMEKWGALMEQWGHDLARRQAEAADGSEAPQVAPMPPMPAMPGMPPLPPAPAEMAVPPTVPHVSPHTGSSGVPHVTVPRIRPPRMEVPRIDPMAPPAIPEKRENQQEAVSRTEHDIDLAPGRLLEVKNEMGSITVRGGEGPGARLIVTVKGRAETMEEAQAIADQARPVIQPLQDGVSVAMTKPQQQDEEQVNRVVTMELIVPRDARLRLSQNCGDIRLTGLEGSIRAVSNMGSIRTDEVRGRVSLESNMGSIDFIAPGDLSAKVQAKVQMGSIQSDLPLEFVKADSFSMGDKASGTIGGGEGDLSLTANMGSIRIRSQSSEPARVRPSRREPRPESQPEPLSREVF